MRIHFGLEFDGQIWGGPPDSAAFDEVACGPLQLVGELESQLGIANIQTPTFVRAAALLPRLSTVLNAYWLRSAESDGLGTAVRLVRDYDALIMAGWEPGTGSPRLRQLAQLCAQVPSGPGQRLRNVVKGLTSRKVRLKHLRIYAALSSFSGLWRTAIDALAKVGVEIIQEPALKPTGPGDLGAAARRSGDFAGDGSLQCLAPRGAIEAADHVAAWLAADRAEGTVIVTPDAVLDTALARHGLPTLGLASPAGKGAMQLIPLSFALAWTPIDPRHAVETLSITPNPLSKSLRRQLLGALDKWPAVGSPAWSDAAAQATEAEKLALAALFSPKFDRLEGGYAADEITSRCNFLKAWFATLAQPAYDAIAVCDAIEAVLAASGVPAWSEGQMQRLLSRVMSQASHASGYEAQAGLCSVATPGAIVKPARRIVWWNFHDTFARVTRPLPLTFAEQQQLRGAGLMLPTPGEVAAQSAEGWRQPLLAATESVLLVSPRTSAVGEAAHPHPLWDEILAAVPRPQRAAAQSHLVVKRPVAPRAPARSCRKLRALPAPAANVRVKKRELKREGPESPGSLETLLGCSYKWALKYVGKLDDGGLPIVTPNNLHIGSFAHQVLQELLADPRLRGEEAAKRAVAQFDTLGPLHLAPIFLPGASAERDAVRSSLDRAAHDFFELRHKHRWHVAGTEMELSKTFEGVTLRGYLDLQLDEPLAVIDFKWGGYTHHSDKLRDNTASQLAAYSYLSAVDEQTLPPIAYYIVKNAKLLTPERGALAGGARAGGDVHAILQALRAGVRDALVTLRAGKVTATGNLSEPVKKDAVIEGVLHIAPPCNFCEFSGLCGTAWEHAHDA